MRFTLNGAATDVAAHPMARLLDVLREECGLTGTKEGCGEGECGACTVLIDGAAICACLVPVAQVEGSDVVTIEGLGGDHPLQHLFMSEIGAQCGICTPGMILAALSLGDRPTLDDVKIALAGNLCRCTGYGAIYRAVLKWKGVEGGVVNPDACSLGEGAVHRLHRFHRLLQNGVFEICEICGRSRKGSPQITQISQMLL